MIGRFLKIISGANINSHIDRQLKIIKNSIFSNTKENRTLPKTGKKISEFNATTEAEEINKFSTSTKNIYYQLRSTAAAYRKKVE